ncbi:MAG TPA: OmpA family protein [Saprospiraceae bacterium]|nr:OmpA family protein [Saprospiraceae bacterium]
MNKLMYQTFFVFIIAVLSCSAPATVRDGKTAFERKQYNLAASLLEKEYTKADTRVKKGKIAWLVGLSLKNTGESAQSVKWFKTAYDNQFGVEALREYAFALKQTEKYKEAESAFRTLGQEIGSPFEYRKEITACQSAARWLALKDDNGYKISPASFNTAQNEYAPYISKDGDIYFTADKQANSKQDKYYWTGRGFSDIFILKKNDTKPEKLNTNINTANNEGTISISPDGKTMIFTRCDGEKNIDRYCKLMQSEYVDGQWSTAVQLEFQQERINYMHPAFSADGNTLFFASNDPNGIGGYDVYFTQKSKGSWLEPQILPNNINTAGNEKFPYLDADTLYFASDGWQGMGGLDIFKVSKSGTNTWNQPINLQAPMNSGSDDFGLTVDPGFMPNENVFKKGYFSSNRPGGSGKDDIYEFRLVKVEPKPKAAPPGDLYLDVYVLEKIRKDPADPNSTVIARKPIKNAKLTVLNLEGKKDYNTSADEAVSIKLNPGAQYQFTAGADGFLTGTSVFSAVGISPIPGQDQRFELEIVLDKIFKNKEIILENIYYDFDKWDIRQDAMPTLNKLAGLLKSNPDIKIQLGSHTDCRGGTAYNQILSQKRAQSVVDYLIAQQIAPERLTAVGFGESKPAVNCECSKCSEDEYQTNRRTTFTILE